MAEAARLDAHLRIAGPEAGRCRPITAESAEGIAQEARVALVKRLEAIDRLNRVVEDLRLEGLGVETERMEKG